MAKNTGDGYRQGSVTDRTQTYNPKNDTHVKRDTSTGKLLFQRPFTLTKVDIMHCSLIQKVIDLDYIHQINLS